MVIMTTDDNQGDVYVATTRE